MTPPAKGMSQPPTFIRGSVSGHRMKSRLLPKGPGTVMLLNDSVSRLPENGMSWVMMFEQLR